jgi:Flp pilus assembly pilin Flp
MFRQLRERALRTSADCGQTMTEYAVVLGIITLGVVGAVSALSGGILSKLGEVTGILGGVVL